MRRSSLLILPLLLSAALVGCGDGDDDEQKVAEAEVPASAKTDELLVDLEDGDTIEEFLERYPELDAEAVRWSSPHSKEQGLVVVKLDKSKQDELLAKLRKDDEVDSASYNFRVKVDPIVLQSRKAIPDDDPTPPGDSFPNDPFYDKQWNMRMVHAREAWRHATGEGVIVAVVDTGVAYEKDKGVWAPDLESTRFVKGYDFVNDDEIAADDNGHGTHCAGTIAQSTHNEKGVVGLARGCKIMPVKVLSKWGGGSIDDVADGIYFAAKNGAHVISMSLGGPFPCQAIADAVQFAIDKGCIVVAAAGNSSGAVGYPAAYPNVIAVSSVGPSGKLAYYSCYGKRIFMAAPGGDMREGTEDGVLQNTIELSLGAKPSEKTVYAYYQGTSMATPHVAAAAALLVSVGVTRPDAVKDILAKTADGEKWNEQMGHGLLDAGAAVRYATFTPGLIGLILAAIGVVLLVLKTSGRLLFRPLLGVGALMGACGLFFLAPLGVGEIPVVGGLLTHAVADWGLVLFGPTAHWNALLASCLIPTFFGLVTIKNRVLNSAALGLMVGWAARLVTGIVLPWADVRWIPGDGALDAIWLGGNAAILVLATVYFARLGRTKRGSVTL